MDSLDATFTSTIWSSPDTDHFIARVRTEDGATHTVLGPPPTGRTTGVLFKLHGEWTNHATHGRQFKYVCAEIVRTNKAGIIAYLQSVCPGVGDRRAQQLYAAFAGEAVDVLRHDPARVVEAGILTADQARAASQALHDDGAWQATRIALLDVLANRGFQLGRLLPLIIQRWRRNAPEIVRRNPYALLLSQLPSCGWKRVDKLYLDLGHPRDRLKRQALTLTAYLLDGRNCDTWVSQQAVEGDLRSKFGNAMRFRDAVRLAKRGRLVAVRRSGDTTYLAPRKWADDEATVAARTKELMAWMPTVLPTMTRPTSAPTNATSAPQSDYP